IRMCCNFKYVNSGTIDQPYCYPRIDDMIRNVSPYPFITKLDATSGYWQIGVREEDVYKTSFITNKGQYAWKVMPFGLRCCSSFFQRMVDKVLYPYRDFSSGYIDDITVVGLNFNEHVQNLDKVLTAFSDVGITFKLKKCEFAKPSVTLLGFQVGSGSISVLKDKIEAILNIPEPTTKKQVRSFLGMCNFYRSYIPNLSTTSSSLVELTTNNSKNKFVLNESQRRSFLKLKSLLTETPVLVCPDYTKPFIIHTDASDEGVGAVLQQQDEQGNLQPIAYSSKKFDSCQKKWSTIDKEAFSLIYSLENFEHIIFGCRVIVYTDHNPLQYLSDIVPKSPKLSRWALAIQKFNIKIHHIQGKQNLVADSLSRLL
ncbi:MAG: reverse transcriptase family protein, partial [Nitrososphaeraceae archaeon]|nr:reverse transcriptase family protein [Nitrososphaeraceae archaeon]